MKENKKNLKKTQNYSDFQFRVNCDGQQKLNKQHRNCCVVSYAQVNGKIPFFIILNKLYKIFNFNIFNMSNQI